jgi:K(+)-stimulated pyrophosphate-energized sodium pump
MSVMAEWLTGWARRRAGVALVLALAWCVWPIGAGVAAQEPAPAGAEVEERRPGGEVNLELPDLGSVDVGGYNGRTLLVGGIGVSLLGILFGLVILYQIKHMPVHRSMREISELIYETCKTYLITQGKFIALLEIFIAVVIVLYFGVLAGLEPFRVLIILLFSVVGILGSYGVAWFGIRVNTYRSTRFRSVPA